MENGDLAARAAMERIRTMQLAKLSGISGRQEKRRIETSATGPECP